ncbi:MAG: DUF3052 family protein [Chloroflexi bacterium]|nr:DUF3052 family protein [Chloroflexota bacterium]
MGQEARCTVEAGDHRSEGKASLETDYLLFRSAEGAFRLKIPLSAIQSVTANEGRLTVRYPDGEALFHLGRAAEKWVDRILHPPSLLDKLGVRPGHRALVVGLDDKDFWAALQECPADVVARAPANARSDNDLIFVGVNRREDLDQLLALQRLLCRDGAIWVIRPKGRPEITERDVMAAGKQAGLVDVKVARFSDTHTAEKFVLPVARRT